MSHLMEFMNINLILTPKHLFTILTDIYIYVMLKKEPQGEILESIFTQEFVDEMKRRAKCLDMEYNRDFWFGVKACDMTPQVIIDALKNN